MSRVQSPLPLPERVEAPWQQIQLTSPPLQVDTSMVTFTLFVPGMGEVLTHWTQSEQHENWQLPAEPLL